MAASLLVFWSPRSVYCHLAGHGGDLTDSFHICSEAAVWLSQHGVGHVCDWFLRVLRLGPSYVCQWDESIYRSGLFTDYLDDRHSVGNEDVQLAGDAVERICEVTPMPGKMAIYTSG